MDLNDTVTVTLTKRGAEILNGQARILNSRILSHHFDDSHFEGEIYKTQLWSIIDHFGGYCSIGSEIVFTNLRKA